MAITQCYQAPSATVMLPSHILKDRSSLDVFLVSHPDNTVDLVPSPHAGHQFFRCLVELNRTKFKNAPTRTACSLVSTICDNGKARIFETRVDSTGGGANEWQAVGCGGRAEELISRALQTILSPDSHSLVGTTKSINQAPRVRKETPSQEKQRPTKRPRIAAAPGRRRSSYEGAQVLLTLSHNTEPNRPGSPEFTKITEKPLRPDSPRNSKKQRLLARASKMQEDAFVSSAKASSPCNGCSDGIPLSEINKYDVLVGASGHGVLATANPGNRRFRALIEAKARDFGSLDDDKSQMLRMAKLAVLLVQEAQPRGRFLVLCHNTGLWHEVRPEKAWSKALRTFRKAVRVQTVKELKEITERRAAPKHLLKENSPAGELRSVTA